MENESTQPPVWHRLSTDETLGITTVTSADAALASAGDAPEVMIIGGAHLYTQLLPRVQRIYLTQIDATFDGDAWFPDLDAAVWQETARENHASDERNPYAYSFLVLERQPQ